MLKELELIIYMYCFIFKIVPQKDRCYYHHFIEGILEEFLAVQWLGLCPFLLRVRFNPSPGN